MASDLNDFLKLMAEAKKKKEEQEKETAREKLKENSQFLGELFSIVAQNKTEEVKEPTSVAPETVTEEIVSQNFSQEIENALSLIKNIEDKAQEIEKRLEQSEVDNKETRNLVDEKLFSNDALEKKFLDMYTRLKDDFLNLKKYIINQRPSEMVTTNLNYIGGAAGGPEAFDRNVFFQNDSLPLRVPTIATKTENFLLYKIDGDYVIPYIWIPEENV